MSNQIKVEFYQHDNFICGRCVEMPEIIRGAGKIIENNRITISSSGSPALYIDALYLRGWTVERDNKWFFLECSSKKEAKMTIKNFQALINKWNKKNNKKEKKNKKEE